MEYKHAASTEEDGVNTLRMGVHCRDVVSAARDGRHPLVCELMAGKDVSAVWRHISSAGVSADFSTTVGLRRAIARRFALRSLGLFVTLTASNVCQSITVIFLSATATHFLDNLIE